MAISVIALQTRYVESLLQLMSNEDAEKLKKVIITNSMYEDQLRHAFFT